MASGKESGVRRVANVNSWTYQHVKSARGANGFSVTINTDGDWAIVAFVINPA